MSSIYVLSHSISLNRMDDMMDAFDDDVEEEADEITMKVLDEIGVKIGSTLPEAASGSLAVKKRAPVTTVKEDKETNEAEKLLASLGI